MKFLWVIAGGVSLVLGIIGVFLPILPTTPFVLLTAFCWAKSSDKLYNKLLAHPVSGQMITDWQQHRAIPQKARYFAYIMMSLSIAMLCYRWWGSQLMIVVVIVALFCFAVAVWMWRLPSKPPRHTQKQ